MSWSFAIYLCIYMEPIVVYFVLENSMENHKPLIFQAFSGNTTIWKNMLDIK